MKFFLFFLSLIFIFLTFPEKFDMYFLNSVFGFICYVPVFFLIDIIKKNNKEKSYKNLYIVFLLSICINLILFSWVVPTITMFGINFFLALLFLILLAFYLSLFLDIFFYVFYINEKKSFIFMSAIFTILEFIRSYLFTGFPWNLLATSEWTNIYFLQISDILGIYGISFFLILINFLIFDIINTFLEKKFPGKKISFLLILIASIYSYGILRINFLNKFYNENKKNEKTYSKSDYNFDSNLRISLLHNNINPYEKFNINSVKSSYNNLINKNKNIDLFIMSETSYPYNFYLDQKDIFLNSIENFFDNFSNNYIIGDISIDKDKTFNSAILIDKNSNFIDKYDKLHLVPFGEFFPMEKLIFKFFPKLSKNLGGINKGENLKNIVLNDFHIAINICYEAIFPKLVKKSIFHDTDFIVNISNDSWQQNTSAILQHFVNNIFRAIENRKYLFRVSNMGISAIISPSGKIIKKAQANENTRLDYEFKKNNKNIQTFYTKFGNLFLYILILYIFITIFYERKFNKLYN